MLFRWHHALWLLAALPPLVGAYVVLLRRRDRQALRFTGLGLVREAFGFLQGLRAHTPALLLLLGLTALLLSAARPVLVFTTPSEEGKVVLLIDVSLSMAASDVPPTRLAAARAAAIEFVKTQPPNVRIGVVVFGGHADVLQSPTENRKDVLAALDNLQLQRFTALGNGLMAALMTLDPTVEIGEEYDIFGTGRPPENLGGIPLEKRRVSTRPPRKPVAPGSYLSAAIVLVSDGRGTMGVPALVAAQMAADRGIRIYTIGVGTLYGGVANVEGWPPIHAEFDEDTLQKVADVTRGEYFLARTADKVSRIYENLGRRVILKKVEWEITVVVTLIGVVLAIAGAGLSLTWSHRPA